MLGYLGAWPFSSLAPAILTREALCKIVAILTQRYQGVLKGGRRDRAKLIFRALAVHDTRLGQVKTTEKPEVVHDDDLEQTLKTAQAELQSNNQGFKIDAPGNDEDDEDDDDMALAALEALDAIEVFNLEREKLESTEGRMRQAQLPLDNFRSLVLLMLVIAPLQPQETLSSLVLRSTDENMERIQQIADSILWSFGPEKNAGITNSSFKTIINQSLPFIFEGFNPLFEHFLFSKHLNLSKRRGTGASQLAPPVNVAQDTIPEPILATEGSILTPPILCQLSFFIPSSILFHRLRPLYSGSVDGFSINSFETKVLNWRAPTILLVSGTREALHHGNSLTDLRGNMPSRRFPPGASGNGSDNKLVFGVYLDLPWKHTHKEPLNSPNALLFQLTPIHDVLKASTLNHDHATLTKSGLSFGSPVPRGKPVSGLPSTLPIGAVSLNLDENLEYGVFMHDSAGGGAFGTSRAKRGDFEERFEIENLEVWGCGGDDVAKEQRERWQWEEREAAARRGVKLGKDKDADYALLEMAGLVGQHRSGGSMA